MSVWETAHNSPFACKWVILVIVRTTANFLCNNFAVYDATFNRGVKIYCNTDFVLKHGSNNHERQDQVHLYICRLFLLSIFQFIKQPDAEYFMALQCYYDQKKSELNRYLRHFSSPTFSDLKSKVTSYQYWRQYRWSYRKHFSISYLFLSVNNCIAEVLVP